ncbi:MAG: cation:proton antiporter [Bacilli bacterium]|nr:cation:proton antiporter [Bacilli bacterium]
MLFLRFLLAVLIAFICGKLISKLKLPAILGWLIAGMILGPYALKLINNDIINSSIYKMGVNILECSVGLLIGTEIIFKKIAKTGKEIITITIVQSIGTFLFVSLVFGIIFFFMNIPLYLALIFGGIALATAPAPAISVVKEFKTKGPVTDTLLPLAALDDIIGVIVFFSVIAFVNLTLNGGTTSPLSVVLMIVAPIVIGILCGLLTGFIMKKIDKNNFVIMIISLLVSSIIGLLINYQLLQTPILNFMLIGMAFSSTFANMIGEEKTDEIMKKFNPILGISMIVVILNLALPLDYHLIAGAGIFTLVYIVSRACGKYFGAFFGAKMSKAPATVQKYLGLTLLPHSGVSLVFTGITVSTLITNAPELASIVQGTIASAAVINEIIAVIIARQGFKLANEIPTKEIKKV